MACALYLCCLIATGYPFVAPLARHANRLETAALSLCVGPGVVGICLIFLSMLGVRPVEGEILEITAVLAIVGIAVWKWGPKREPIEAHDSRPAMWWRIGCYAGIGYGIYAVCKDVFVDPVIEWDAFAIWQMKAQVLAILPLHPRPEYFSNLNLSYSHLRYPLLVPMVSAGMHAMTGSLDDFGKMVSLLWYGGMVLAVYAMIKRLNGATAALTATALLACSAPITHFGGSGTAEMALTAFFACSVLCILRWRETHTWGYVVIAGLLGAFMAWTKNEGVAMAAVNVVVVAVCGGNWKKNLSAAALMAAIGTAIYAPWIVYTSGLPRTDENYAGRLNAHELILNSGRLWTVLTGYGWELINWQDWGLFWIILAGLAILERRKFRSGAIILLAATVVLQLAVYVPVLMVTNWKLDELMAVTLGRLFMHVAPAGAVLIGAIWPQWVGGATADLEKR